MIIGTIFSITPAFVYWLAGTLAASGDASAPTIGDIVAFTTLQSRLFFPLGQLLNVQVEIQGALALFDRIFEYLEMDPRDRRRARCGRARPARSHGPHPLRDVSFHYPAPPCRTRRTTRASRTSRRRPPRRTTTPKLPPRPRKPHPRPPRRASRLVAIPPFGLEDIDFTRRAGRARRARRPVGLGQDHDDLPHPAAVRRRTRARSRSTASTSGRSPWHRSARSIGFVTQETYLFHASDPRQPRVRPPGRDRGRARGGGARRGDPRPDRRAPRRLRHGRRRARLQALGRREAADRDRPGPAQGPADPHPRRGDLGPRHGVASG